MRSRLMVRMLVISTLLYSGILASAVPGEVNFQGVLLDNTNQLVNGTADFDFAFFDAPGGGTLLWSESQTGVPVNGGAYSVALGSVNPITTTLLSGGAVYLEVTVDGDTLSPRQRLLAVPYALEAASVNGVSGVFIQQIFQNIDYDSQSQPNDHPEQGFDDVDGDGRANFIDPDNDGDGLQDDTELANGTDINLFSPHISSIQNSITSIPYSVSTLTTARAGQNTTLNVVGSGFLPSMTVEVGSETVVPQNLTSTSFDVSVGATLPPGQAVITVTVTLANTESDSSSISLAFYNKLAFVTGGVVSGGLDQTTTAADAFCAQSASNAGVPGTFVAWFSDTDAGIGPLDRITDGAWARLDGEIIATSLSDLTDGTIGVGINIKEDGNVQNSNFMVATSTTSDGLPDPQSCSIASPSRGSTGDLVSTSMWTWSPISYLCSLDYLFYCFEQ